MKHTCFILMLLLATSLMGEKFTFHPISHASFVIASETATIYVDPVGDLSSYKKFKKPDIILITHEHHDHYQKDLIEKIKTKNTTIIANPAVQKMLTYGKTMKNGDKMTIKNITIEAIPAYNTTKERLKFHPKDRDNGYVVTVDGKRIYISGDTEDIKEMRTLKNIDHAFICMNLPFTMTEKQAASAVLEFKPKQVYPYHYRGKPSISDINKFKKLVTSKNKNIKVTFLKWYK